MTAVVVAVRPGQSPRVAEPEAAPGHRRVVTWYVLVASLTFFGALQHVLLAASYRADVARVGTGLAMASTPQWWASMGRFVALAVAAIVAVAAGRRWLAIAAVSVAVFLPVVVPSTAFMLTATRMPQPIGAGWYLQTSAVRQPPAALLWFGAFVDVALVLAPAAAGGWISSETRPRRRPTPLDVAAFGLCLTGLGLYSYQRVLMHGLDGTSPWADLLSLLPLFAVGAVCSGRRMSRLVLVIGLAVISTYEVTLSLVQVRGPSLASTLTSRQTWSPLVPAVIAAGLGAMWVPVARLAAGLATRTPSSSSR